MEAITLGWPVETRETVCDETPASRATSPMETPRFLRPDGSGGGAPGEVSAAVNAVPPLPDMG
ncbi:hypothetical protein GCM10022267_35990 [Lentzea roselyniae]|uniref:Uncharacterized protein n=1 Tax=Lentzea roselyniae TaxID=531940 RepID=A0ABP7B1J2_9PSEU